MVSAARSMAAMASRSMSGSGPISASPSYAQPQVTERVLLALSTAAAEVMVAASADLEGLLCSEELHKGSHAKIILDPGRIISQTLKLQGSLRLLVRLHGGVVG